MKKIKKRDGRMVSYDKSKIINAIEKAKKESKEQFNVLDIYLKVFARLQFFETWNVEDIQDLIEGRNWLRKKSGATMADAVMPMPPIPLSSATFPMLEYADTQKEQDTGVTRYNQGLDARSLNKTASGIKTRWLALNEYGPML